MNITELTDKNKDLEQFSIAQTALIASLNKKINQLETENKHLQELIEQAVPSIIEENGQLELIKNVSDEMAICIMQIRLLKDKCRNGFIELTQEEAKKLDIYTKLLISLKNNGEKINNPVEKLGDDDFNKQLETLIGPT